VTRKAGLGNLRAAIGEAAFMTGIEAQFRRRGPRQLRAALRQRQSSRLESDLISFDDAHWFGSPSYLCAANVQ